MNIDERCRAVNSSGDLAAFLKVLEADLRANRGQWENASLPRFLEAMSGWLDDMDGYYKNQGLSHSEISPWRTVADALAAARHYE